MTTPLFSIIIPVYNVENFVYQSISSVLSQDFHDYEIIVVDDGSTDKSAEICFEFAKNTALTYVRKKNEGVSEARNLGLKLAQGDYVMFLDSDDYWLNTNVLSELSELIKKKDYPDIIFHPYSSINLQDGEKYKYHAPGFACIDQLTGEYKNDFSLLIHDQIYLSNIWTKVTKKEIIRNNRILFPKGKRYEDSAWSFELAKYIQTYAIYNTPFYQYQAGRIGSTTMHIPFNNIRDFIDIIATELNQLEEIKSQYFYLYQGLFNYIAKEIHFLIQFFNHLKDEEKQRLLPTLSECVNLFNHYVNTDFSPQK